MSPVAVRLADCSHRPLRHSPFAPVLPTAANSGGQEQGGCMQIEQHLWTGSDAWVPHFSNGNAAAAQLAFVFGARERLQRAELIEALRTRYPHAYVFGCSTAGEICDTRVHDDSVVVTAVHFEHSQVRAAETN